MEDRFDQIMQLSPRRFHVSDSPPFGYGIVFCGHTNGDDEDCITNQSSGIINCKPGIWRSATREVEQPETAQGLGCDMECYVYWVSDGSIDMTQSVQVWEAYEEKSRSEDESVDLDDILPEGVEWTRAGSYYDDGGVCTVLSTEYLTKAAARKIMTGSRTDNDEEEEVEYGYYLETITLNHMDGDTDNYGFTLGGLACKHASNLFLQCTMLMLQQSWPRLGWGPAVYFSRSPKWSGNCD